MAIDPVGLTAIRVGQLPEAPIGLSDNFAHEVGTDLKRATIQQLSDLIATQIGSSSGVGYLPISVVDGQQLPDVPTDASFFLCGKGTFLNINGYPDIVCTEELNAIMSVTDHWEIAVQIPIEVNPEAIGIAQTINEGVLDSAPSQDAVYQALHQYLNSVGSFHYADEATQTTPISVTSGVDTKLTNDALGTYTDIQNAPYGVPTVWDAVNNQFDFSSLSIGDLVHIRPDLTIDLVGTNTSYEVYMKFAVGTASEWTLSFSNAERKSTDAFKKNAYLGFDIGNEDTNTAPAEIWIKTDANATVKVNGWYIEVLRKNINITSFEDTNAVHKTGDEVISGTKTFKEPLDASGVVTINGDEIKIANISPVESVRLTPISIIKQKAGVDYTYSLPDKSGTVAMTSDIPTTPTLQQVSDAGKTVSYPDGVDGMVISIDDTESLGYYGLYVNSTSGANGINASSTNGMGVYASSDTGTGVVAYSNTGSGVDASSNDGNAVYALSITGNGVYAYSIYGRAGVFNIDSANTENIVEFQKNGTNQAYITHDGNLTAKGATLSTAPTTSAATFDVLTRDTTSGIVEKKASSFFQTALTNPITGTGASGQVAFWNGTNTQTGSNNLFWDATNNRLRINQDTDVGFRLDVNGTARITSTLNTDADAVVNGVNIGRGAGNIVSNTRVGQNALNANTTGDSNTANGVYALFANTTGGGNTANGVYALFANTTGNDNTANGVNALFANTTGGGNTANGYYALVSNTTGNNNTANGVQALQNNTTGGGNTANGYYAGRYISDGTTALTISNDSVFLGRETKALADNQTNQIVIGTSAVGLGSNTTVLGNSSTLATAIYGNLLLGTTTNSTFRLDVNGTARLNGLTTIQGTTASDTAPLGAELLTTGTGDASWTGTSFATGYTHVVGSVTTLTSTLAAVISTLYQITYTVTGRTSGSFTIAFGGSSTAGITATGAVGPLASTTGTLVITPTTDFNGTIVLSIRTIGTATATTTFISSAGVVTNEIRVSNINSNTFIGLNAGRSNTTGSQNTALGRNALESNTTGNNNTANGFQALRSNTTGVSNTANGVSALSSNTTGNSNTANGEAALRSNTIGSNNTANGVSALSSNTTGGNNTANGVQALRSNTTGVSNTANGVSALSSNTTGGNNTANGVSALQNNTTGGGNTANGFQAGRFIADGTTALTISNDSVFLGRETKALADNQTNQIVIGTSAIGLGSNTTVLGNSSTTDTAIYGRLLSGTTAPIASAQVQIDSTTRGFLPPRMTTTQINAISSPAVGLVVYNTTLDVLCYRDSVGWKKVTSTIM